MEILQLLYGTVILRPYVFVFLAFYLLIATWNMGLFRTLIYTVMAYGVAFASEYSSTRNGFPYGFYSYIETTRGQELWVANVPFMDSLSYAFLSYVSYTLALLFWSPLRKNGWDVRLAHGESGYASWRVAVTGAVLFMLLDVIVDPVAFRGDRWFLGKIYNYREKGGYFDIPLTNFGGWLLVGAATLLLFARLREWLDGAGFKDVGMRDVPAKALLGPGLYFGVLAFNLTMTFYIEEYLLGACGLAIAGSIFLAMLYKIRRR